MNVWHTFCNSSESNHRAFSVRMFQNQSLRFYLQKLEDVETLSDIVDNENAVDDLSDDDTKEPRLVLPKLKEDKNVRKVSQKSKYSTWNKTKS